MTAHFVPSLTYERMQRIKGRYMYMYLPLHMLVVEHDLWTRDKPHPLWQWGWWGGDVRGESVREGAGQQELHLKKKVWLYNHTYFVTQCFKGAIYIPRSGWVGTKHCANTLCAIRGCTPCAIDFSWGFWYSTLSSYYVFLAISRSAVEWYMYKFCAHISLLSVFLYMYVSS